MRVLFLNTSFPPVARSAAHLYHQLGKYLVTAGHTVKVVTEVPWRRLVNADEFHPPPTVDGMSVEWVRSHRFAEDSMVGRGINAIGLPRSFYKAIPDPNVHDVSFIYSPPITLGLAGARLKKRERVPFVLNVQDIYPRALIDLGLITNKAVAAYFSRVERRVYEAADRILVHSDGNAQYLGRQHPTLAPKISVLPNWVDLDLFDPTADGGTFRGHHQLDDSFVVGYAGTMGYAQDLSTMIDAADRLKRNADIAFVLVGEGVRLDEWKAMCAERRLSNVRFIGLQHHEDYPNVIAAMDVGMVSLSGAVTTPVVPGKLLDLMAGGRPIIANVPRDNDTAGIVQAADCGVAVEPNDGKALAAAVSSLWEDREECRRLGFNGRKYAADHFSIDRSASILLDAFRAAL